ncbi:MAG: hypothetical protein WBO46_12575 [Caldilineaceae bacterium]
MRRILALFLTVWLGLVALPAGNLSARSLEQESAGGESHLFLLPLGETSVELLTHTVDAAVFVDSNGFLAMDITASYRLHNPNRSPTTLLVQMDGPPGEGGGVPRLPQNISLELNGQAVVLQPTGNGLQQTAQLNLSADERRTLLLRYTLHFGDADLPAFVYPANILNVWPGRVGSWRVTLTFADSASGPFAPDQWLAAEPDGWSYQGDSLQWLSEDNFPRQPLRWQVINPRTWQDLRARRQLLGQQPQVVGWLELGDIYLRLFERTGQQTGNQSAYREGFYAQSLAAYLDGIRLAEAEKSDPLLVARLHRGLAGLYRSRSIQPGGAVDPAYVELMVASAEDALAVLPPTATGEQSELTGWLADGLRLQTTQARQRKDWPAALALLDRLAALPANVVDGPALAEERRLLLLEQALQFLAQGNEKAALALAGSSLAADDLLPASERQTIFARWQFDVTIGPDDLAVSGVGVVIPGREEEARRSVEQLAVAWQTAQPTTGQATVQFDGTKAAVHLTGISLAERLALIQATPQNVQWALLRTLLVNTDVELEQSVHLIWQRTVLRYSLDLRPVADQWAGIAASLERDSLAAQGSGSTEDRLRGELLAITHRQEAARWHRLVEESRVQLALNASPSAQATDSQVWSLPLTASPQPLSLSREVVSLPRLLLAIVLAMASVFLLAGILWLLL